MDALAAGADIGTMLTSVSAVTAAYVWIRTRWSEWQRQRAEIHLRNWHGYIDVHGIDTWYVHLEEDSEIATARVVLEATGGDGRPDVGAAQRLRRSIQQNGMLSRSPTPHELDFLSTLREKDGYGRRDTPVQ